MQSKFVEDSNFPQDGDSIAGDEYFTDDDDDDDDSHSTMSCHFSANGIHDDLVSEILTMDIAIGGSGIDENGTQNHDLVEAASENPIASYSGVRSIFILAL